MAKGKYNRYKTVQQNRNGFTLIEALVIVGIVGMIVGIASISITSSIDKIKFKGEVEDFIRVLKLAHRGASESTQKYLVSINIATGHYQMQTLPVMSQDVFMDENKRLEKLEYDSETIAEGDFSEKCFIEYIIFDDGTDPSEEGYDEAVLYAGKTGWASAMKMVFSDTEGNQYSLLTNRLNSDVKFVQGDAYLPEPMLKQDVPF